ncbi:unnamed protein product [Lactuca saligna]|uniref:Uncharacterized protein n=1 Tax=Lactuca saligna TaxID=75948 RepID=A0AA36EN25_LACSI|nr:unnamed protein product [Lactuca saligna]
MIENNATIRQKKEARKGERLPTKLVQALASANESTTDQVKKIKLFNNSVKKQHKDLGVVCFFKEKLLEVCGPPLQSSVAEEVEQTAAAFGLVLRHAAHAQQFLSQKSSEKQIATNGQMMHVCCTAQQ